MTPRVLHDPPAPGSDLWKKTITASKIPAMLTDKSTGEFLGIDYFSAFERWHMMNGTWTDEIDESKQAMFDDAHDAEDYAVNVWKRRNPGWQTNAGEIAYTDDSLPFPNVVTLDRRARRGRKFRIIEVKRPRFNKELQGNWLVQVNTQMGVSDIHEADLVLVPVYGEPEIIHLTFDPDLYWGTISDAEKFWISLQTGTPPDAGDSEHAKEIFAALNPDSDAEAEFEVPDDLMDKLLDAYADLSSVESRVITVQNLIAEQMGDAAKATYRGAKVATRSNGRFAQSRLPKEHKNLLKDPELMAPKFDPGKLKKIHPDIHAAATSSGSFTFERKAWEKNES